MKLIAIVGMAGSGKSEAAKLIEENGFKRIRFGDITDEEIKKQGLALSEENEKKVREGMRETYGMAAYAKLNLSKIEKYFEESDVILDGLYSWEEYTFLKEKFPEMIVLAVYCPPELRYERLLDRDVRPLTREQAISRDKKEIVNLHKAGPIAMADYTLFNVGTIFDLKNNLDKFFEWLEEKDE
jgi:dephospho-CoA kinase